MTEYQYASITEQEHEALLAYLQSEYYKNESEDSYPYEHNYGSLNSLEKSGETVFNSLSESDIWACKRYANLLSVVFDYERQITELKAILAEKRKELDTLVHYDPNTQMYILRKDD